MSNKKHKGRGRGWRFSRFLNMEGLFLDHFSYNFNAPCPYTLARESMGFSLIKTTRFYFVIRVKLKTFDYIRIRYPSCLFLRFSLLWMLFVPIICFRVMLYLMAVIGNKVRVFYNFQLSVCNMCRCFIRISFKFGDAGLYVTDIGMRCLSWQFCCWFKIYIVSLCET